MFTAACSIHLIFREIIHAGEDEKRWLEVLSCEDNREKSLMIKVTMIALTM